MASPDATTVASPVAAPGQGPGFGSTFRTPNCGVSKVSDCAKVMTSCACLRCPPKLGVSVIGTAALGLAPKAPGGNLASLSTPSSKLSLSTLRVSLRDAVQLREPGLSGQQQHELQPPQAVQPWPQLRPHASSQLLLHSRLPTACWTTLVSSMISDSGSPIGVLGQQVTWRLRELFSAGHGPVQCQRTTAGHAKAALAQADSGTGSPPKRRCLGDLCWAARPMRSVRGLPKSVNSSLR